MPRWSRDDSALTVTDDLVIVELPEPSGRVVTHGLPHRLLADPAYRDPIARAIGPAAVAEALVWIAELRLPVLERIRARVRGRMGDRPHVPRSGPGWTIRGRTAIENGQPVRSANAKDPALAAALSTLEALPCTCGTGAATAEEHGMIRSLARVEVDGRVAEVGRCVECGRAWTFAEAGRRTSFDGTW